MNVNTVKTAARWLAAAAAVIAVGLSTTIVTNNAAPADTSSHSLAAGKTIVFPTETLTITVTPHPRPKADPKPGSSPEPS
jgi:hypothetical protein